MNLTNCHTAEGCRTPVNPATLWTSWSLQQHLATDYEERSRRDVAARGAEGTTVPESAHLPTDRMHRTAWTASARVARSMPVLAWPSSQLNGSSNWRRRTPRFAATRTGGHQVAPASGFRGSFVGSSHSTPSPWAWPTVPVWQSVHSTRTFHWEVHIRILH
jgi:hypothetical protein